MHRYHFPMAPKERPISELGSVLTHGNGWRARVQIDGKQIVGPKRATKKEAEADLALARQSTSRDEFVQCLQEMLATVKKEQPVKVLCAQAQ